ncbi:MAG TPA: RNA polymerase sigma factor [Planctomycetota bacterium]
MTDERDSPAPFPPELREGLRRREPLALARFFDASFDRVYAYLERLVGDAHTAEDLAQETFLQVHRALDSYDPARDPRPWLFTIATNKLRDHWRAQAARGGERQVSLEAEDLGERAAWFAAPPELAGAEELAATARAAIAALPEGLRAALTLRLDEGLSFEDIGRILGRNEVAARKRYSRALAALRARLGRAFEERAGELR